MRIPKKSKKHDSEYLSLKSGYGKLVATVYPAKLSDNYP